MTSPSAPFTHGARVYIPVPAESIVAAHDALTRALEAHPLSFDIAIAIGRLCVYLPPDHPSSASIHRPPALTRIRAFTERAA